MIGQTILHYKILEKLGEGGMGVVYKAEDTKLQRTVALKFLSMNVASDDELRKRFINEAQTASALNHPNICTIYSVEDDDDQPFIAMEFVAGKEMRDLVGAYGDTPLPIDTIVTYATQIAEGLQAAHKKGIVHRDIKPANIMVTDDGLVKVMDFGLAKKKGQAALTKTGSTLGTVAYMSPEQAKNEAVDHRSDIFSFGAVLYELCSGRQPFAGDYEAATLYSVVHEEPEALPDGVSAELQRIVFKCLEKEAGGRYQTAGSLVTDLRELRKDVDSNLNRLAKPKTTNSIIVLPFDDLSPGKDNEYFSDGLTEEIITDLSQVHTLHVISRNSSMMLKGTRKTLKEIGRDVNVQYALTGSVRKAGNNLRITVQLLDCHTDAHL